MGAREALLGATVPTTTVTVGGQEVEVRCITTAGKDALQDGVTQGKGWRAPLLRATCYADGEPLFKPDDDIGSIPSHLTEPLVNAAVKLAAFSEEEIEELEGN